MDVTGRYAFVRLPFEWVDDLLHCRDPRAQLEGRVTLESDLPPDAKVVSLAVDLPSRHVIVLLASETFPHVKQGQRYPEVAVKYTATAPRIVSADHTPLIVKGH